MTRWTVEHGDILNRSAEVLVCSANVFLNLSGGVGGELLLRYGPQMQRLLHQHLADRDIRHVEPGDVVPMSPCGSPYKTVIHAIAVDAFYQSSPALIETVAARALRLAASLGAETVAMAALATGFGRMSMGQFEGIRPLLSGDFPGVREVLICVRRPEHRDELLQALQLDQQHRR